MKSFDYKFDEGPLTSEVELDGNWTVGNCRRAVQYYLWKQRGIFLKPEQVLCPAGYYETGSVVGEGTSALARNELKVSDIIYAEKMRNRRGEEVDRSEKNFPSHEDYIVSLHTALYTGESENEVWHATAIDGASCFWSREKFLYHYRPIVVKRV